MRSGDGGERRRGLHRARAVSCVERRACPLLEHHDLQVHSVGVLVDARAQHPQVKLLAGGALQLALDPQQLAVAPLLARDAQPPTPPGPQLGLVPRRIAGEGHVQHELPGVLGHVVAHRRKVGQPQAGEVRLGPGRPGHRLQVPLRATARVGHRPAAGGFRTRRSGLVLEPLRGARPGHRWGAFLPDDGATFTVVREERPPPVSRPSAAERFKDEPRPACPEPAGGWAVPDPSRRSERYLEPVTRAARAQPDFSGLWLSYLAPMGHNVAEDPGEFVLNVAFTGDPARHEAQLRPRWGGRLCVTRQQRSYRELLRIQRQLQGAAGKKLDLRVLGTGIDEYANAVDLQVVVLEERARAALDARYGAGAVQATAALTPVA